MSSLATNVDTILYVYYISLACTLSKHHIIPTYQCKRRINVISDDCLLYGCNMAGWADRDQHTVQSVCSSLAA